MVKGKQNKAECGQSWRESPPVKLYLSTVNPKSTKWVPHVKLKCWPKRRDWLYAWGEGYYAITAIASNGTVSRCDKELKVELNILDVTEGDVGIPLTEPNTITVSKAKSLQYYFFHTINWLWPGKYVVEFTCHSRRFPNIEPLRLSASVKGPGGRGREGLPKELGGGVETDEGVLNVYDDEEKKTRKRRREAEIVPAKHATRNSKKVKHKKEPITVKETKLKKGKAVHVSSRMSSSAPKCRTSVRMSKSEGEIRPSDAVQTKGKRSSPLVELELSQRGKKLYKVLDEGIPNVVVHGTGNRCIVRIPPSLLQFLERDRMIISRGKGLCRLPRTPSVDEILLTFKRLMRSEDICGRKMLDYLEVAFNVLLEPCLLYTSERSQLMKLKDKEPNLCPSTVYGGEHLLRLLLIIPTCISPGTDPDTRDDHKKITPFTNTYVPKLNVVLDRLLGFLQEKHEIYFLTNDDYTPL